MAFNNIISRTDLAGLIPMDTSREVLDNLTESSIALTLFDRAPNMSTGVTRVPVMSAVPVAYFRNGDTDLIQTTEANWVNKDFTAEEVACIVPIPKNVLADADRDIWAELEPKLKEAVGRAVDAAIFFNVGRPASFPPAIFTQAVAVGNTVTRGTVAGDGGISQDLNLLMGVVEDDGFDVNGWVANRRFRRHIRGQFDTSGNKINISVNELEGEPVAYGMRGLWATGTGAVEIAGGDFSQGKIAIREDINYQIITEGVITDNSTPPQIIYNLPQQGMIAMLVTFRLAFQVSNAVTWENSNDATRWPWAVLLTP
jgi:HK97 family phage major capsid protein